MRISDWSSDVCSSDLIEYLVDQLYAYNRRLTALGGQMLRLAERHKVPRKAFLDAYVDHELAEDWLETVAKMDKKWAAFAQQEAAAVDRIRSEIAEIAQATGMSLSEFRRIVNMVQKGERRSEEHTSELQSLMRISYAVSCLK